MVMTWRPPADLAEELRLTAFILRRSANEILNEATRDWLDTKGKPALAEKAAERSRAALDNLGGS